MPDTITINIMFDDLSEDKQAEILEAVGQGYNQTNYDTFPVCQLVFSEDEAD